MTYLSARGKIYIKLALLSLLMLFCLQLKSSLAADYVGSEHCMGCHTEQYEAWQGSHHDWAMKVASPDSVLGNFNDATYTHAGVTSTFTRVGNAYYVNTENMHGDYETFKIAYTFGVYPLQQYLIAFPQGRYQALTVAWDSRPVEEGGQRWYQLMPNDMGEPGTSLHWTGAYYNWNAQCADCHSTGLEKNYSVQTNSYQTKWSEINVSCESCHGPGSLHSTQPSHSLPIDYSAPVQWIIAKGSKIANPVTEPHTGAKIEIESCAACHSRRTKISDSVINNYSNQDDFLNHFQLQSLRQDLYHADGQILGEVYVHGSFIQSKMFQRGVTCSNCHNPHSLELKAPGNAVCATCHAPEYYDTTKHHFHEGNGNAGAQCVNCHMPSTIYMGVDARRDHSMRIPNPLLAESIGAPDACTNCHNERSQKWAGQAIDYWLKNKNLTQHKHMHFGETFHAARQGLPEAHQSLIDIANNFSFSPIVRSTALELLNNYPDQGSFKVALDQLNDSDPLVRLGALRTLEFLPQQQRWKSIAPLLNDSVATVRYEATRLLLASNPEKRADKDALQSSIERYMASLMISGDMPLGQVNIGNAYRSQRLFTKAHDAYKKALILDPFNVPAMINLADSYRAQGHDKKSLQELLLANEKIPDNPMLRHSLGLAQIRAQQTESALKNLHIAVTLAPDNVRFIYIYAIALNGQGQSEAAIKELRRALKYSANNRDILLALVTINRDSGDNKNAKVFAKQLVDLFPNDKALRSLYNSL